MSVRTMRAVVLDGPGGPEALRLRTVPVPRPHAGQVLVRVLAFGLNRSELHFRRGQATSGSFPRIPGIEAAGVVEEAPGGELAPGTQVAAMMGGMGRTLDGGYAEYVVVPATQLVPFTSALPWDVLGAVPEMLQTAHGSLTVGVRATPGQSLLIRGGTSSVGLTLTVLARMRGLTVLSTTRSAARRALLERHGAQHALVDDGLVAEQVRAIAPGGVDGAVELVGVDALRDTLRAVRPGGTVCFTGMLSDRWTVPEFYPMDWLPNGVRLTAYSGDAADLPAPVLQGFLDAVADGRATVPVGRVYRLDEIVQAHRDMEAGTVGGKGVVSL
ncbi:alcohol dehydrogenase catalytic domain-containing protein [Cellulomonas soli]